MKLKKFLAALLSATMVLSTMSFTAFANEPVADVVIDGTPYEGTVESYNDFINLENAIAAATTSVEINGGEYIAKVGSTPEEPERYIGLNVNTSNNVAVTINGGTYRGRYAAGLSIDGSQNVIVNGGTLLGGVGIQTANTNVKIYGGSFEQGTYAVWCNGGSVVEIYNGTFNGDNGIFYIEGDAKITIMDGKFTTEDDFGSNNGLTAGGGDLTIEGGQFDIKESDKDVTDTSWTDFIHEDKVPELNEETGKFEVVEQKDVIVNDEMTYSTLQAAIEAADDGDVIKLLSSRKETTDKTNDETSGWIEIAADKNVIIDLNGKTLTGAFMVYGTANIKNGTILNKNADVSAIEANGASAVVVADNLVARSARHAIRNDGGKVTINSGTYKSESKGMTAYAVNTSNATTVIKGGRFYGPSNYPEDGATINVRDNSTVEIYDGEFFGEKTNAVLTIMGDGYMSVTGGIFHKAAGQNIVKFNGGNASNCDATGGTFETMPDLGLMADGYLPVKNADGTYTVKEAFTVSFDANGAEGTMPAQYVAKEGTALDANVFTRDGYTFKDWNTAADGKGISYADGDVVMPTEDMTLFAQWNSTVSFDANGGVGTMDAQKVLAGNTVKLTANAFDKKGSVFVEWNTKKDGTGTAYDDGADITPDGDVTLYAQWTNPFVVNGGVVDCTSFEDALAYIEKSGNVGTIQYADDNGNLKTISITPAVTDVTSVENIGANADNVSIECDEAYYTLVKKLADDGANNFKRVDTVKYEDVKAVEGKLLLDVDITPAISYTKDDNTVVEDEKIDLAGKSVTVILKVDAALNGKNVVVSKGDETIGTYAVVNDTVTFVTDKGFSVYTLDITELNNMNPEDVTNTVKAVLKKTAGSENKYELWVEAEQGKRIFNFTVADFKFTYEDDNADTDVGAWEIAGATANGIAMSKTANGVYHFNVVDGTKDYAGTSAVKLADITFNKYATITFKVETDAAEVQTSWLVANVAKSYNVTDNTLIVNNIGDGTDKEGDAIIDHITYDEKKVPVTINLEGLTKIENIFNADYQDMTVTIERIGVASDETKIIKLGADMLSNTANIFDNDGKTSVVYNPAVFKDVNGEEHSISKYIITTELAVNSDYVVTLKGAGYRTYSYKIEKLKSAADLTFWNDAKKVDENGQTTAEKVMGTDENAVKVTFLAGDIVNDGIIDVYDLNAVVSYWDYAFTAATETQYNKYDLNRDGKIDITDVSTVLTAWNE